MVSIFDTAIANYNSGNQIIMDAINSHIDKMFPNQHIIRLPVEDISKNARKYCNLSAFSFVGGTNILNGNINNYRQWDLTLHNILILKKCILIGCGWFQYENKSISKYTKWAYKRILHPNFIHSVRDEYTKNKLEKIGIKAINTGCPTLWDLNPALPGINGRMKSKNCVIALTDYNQNPERDLKLFEIINNNYTNVFLFPQGTGDINYIQNLGISDKIKVLRPRLTEFNQILSEGTDYIGTRLHAGIRAIQLEQRSTIIGIDNRALEMGRDFNLPVLHEESLDSLSSIVNNSFNITLNIPKNNISDWKKQFIYEL